MQWQPTQVLLSSGSRLGCARSRKLVAAANCECASYHGRRGGTICMAPTHLRHCIGLLKLNLVGHTSVGAADPRHERRSICPMYVFCFFFCVVDGWLRPKSLNMLVAWFVLHNLQISRSRLGYYLPQLQRRMRRMRDVADMCLGRPGRGLLRQKSTEKH
jgi:hypothetical protein